jgi:hypothetical protein
VTRAESILKRYIKKKEWYSVEKLLVAIFVNEKRLKDADDVIDDPDLDNLVTENEWDVIVKDKFADEANRQELLSQKWYRRIQIKFQHLCQGELMADSHNTDDEIEE